MLRAVGFSDEDFAKPQIAIASTGSDLTPCNMHIDELATHATRGANDAGGKAVNFSTITISDGISMGTKGMRYSLVSREVIADSIETVVAGEGMDGLVAIGGCDKNMPGCMMAIARLDRPAVFVYGGSILPGIHRKKPVDIVSVYEAVGRHARGDIDDKELKEIESWRHSWSRLLRRHVYRQFYGKRYRGPRYESTRKQCPAGNQQRKAG